MKKILFSLMIFFILHTNSFSNHSEISSPINPFCEGNISQKDLKEIDKYIFYSPPAAVMT